MMVHTPLNSELNHRQRAHQLPTGEPTHSAAPRKDDKQEHISIIKRAKPPWIGQHPVIPFASI